MNKKDLLTESLVNALHSKGKMTESVDWDYYNKFEEITDKYMSSQGEGDTLASQIVTAINKLVYKWYNDGDVFDNVHSGLSGWANDLSSYANWLYKYCEEAKPILYDIYGMSDESDYETLLQELADACLNEEFLKEFEKPKQGSIYDCDGPFEFSEYSEDEEEEDYYDDDEYLDSMDESKKCESRVHRTLSVGDTFQNENGVSVVILDVDDKNQVTYHKKEGKTECHPMESVNNMLNDNGYTKLNESKEVKSEASSTNKLNQLTSALDANNIPYTQKKNKLILQYKNNESLKASQSNKDDIIYDSYDNKVYVTCWLNKYYYQLLSDSDKSLFHDQGQAIIDSAGWVDLDKNLLKIIDTLKAANNAYLKAQEIANAEGRNSVDSIGKIKQISKEVKTEAYTARDYFEANMKRYLDGGDDRKEDDIKVLAENEDFILTGARDEEYPSRIYLQVTSGSYRNVEVFIDQNYKGKVDKAEINWSALGSVGVLETEEFIKHLQLAIEFCKEIDGKDYSSEIK